MDMEIASNHLQYAKAVLCCKSLNVWLPQTTALGVVMACAQTKIAALRALLSTPLLLAWAL